MVGVSFVLGYTIKGAGIELRAGNGNQINEQDSTHSELRTVRNVTVKIDHIWMKFLSS